MKVLVLGAGAIGGYYGARLIQAGVDVTFVVRPGRAQLLSSAGLVVRSSLGDFRGRVQVVEREAVRSPYDLVLLACKSFDLEDAIAAVRPAVGPASAIVPFLNGMAAYDRLDAEFGPDRVHGAVAYIAVKLAADGSIEHMGTTDTVQLGARSGQPGASLVFLHQALARSAGERVLSRNITQALWDKWVMLASGALMNCLMRGTLADILGTTYGRALMVQAIDECMSVASASGHAVAAGEGIRIRARLLDSGSAWAASMMREIEMNAPMLEADAIVGDMAARAAHLGVEATLLRASYCNLQVYLKHHADLAPEVGLH